MIEFRHVHKCLGKKHVLNDVNLQIETGKIFGLIGPNGAGKSTLLRLLAGIYRCDGGMILMDGEKLYDNASCKQDVLFISDDPFQFFHATLKEMKSFYQTWYEFDEQVYQAYLEQFHLDETKPLVNFSKGMKRQAFILLGLAIAPRYLLLDEAFDGLDPLMRRYFKTAISERIAKKAMSVIIASHDLKEMEDFCDCFAMIEDGKIHTSGDMQETLSDIHRIQMAFAHPIDDAWFTELDLIHKEIKSKVVNLYVRGDIEKIETYLRTLAPLMMEVLPVNLEEFFIQEVIGRREEAKR